MDKWEVYKKTNKRTRNKKYISITSSKTFGLPRPFLDEYDINNESNVVILYNAKMGQIALRFSEAKPEFGYSIRFGKSPEHGAAVSARKFFEDKNINAADYAGHYDFHKAALTDLGFSGGKGDVFIIQLKHRKHSSLKKDDNKVEEIEF